MSSNFCELVSKDVMRNYVKPFIITFHKNIRGRERKSIKRIEEEARESLGFEDLGAKVKLKLEE